MTLVLIAMFILTQAIGLAVINAYSPKQELIINQTTGQEQLVNITPQLPYGMQPPEIEPEFSLISIIISFIIAIILILVLMTVKAKLFLRLWFFLVIVISLGITFNSLFQYLFPYSSIVAIALALPIAFFKIFKRNILVHNIAELFVYPGIAVIMVSILNVPTAVIFLLAISIYDIWAVWHSGFMQKMANFQMNELKVFSGFFVPYIGKKVRMQIKQAKAKKNKEQLKKIKVNLAILGGGDVAFPIILAGTVMRSLGLIPAIIVSLGGVVSLFLLFLVSKKGKFYPAMPFLTSGLLFAFAIVGLLF